MNAIPDKFKERAKVSLLSAKGVTIHPSLWDNAVTNLSSLLYAADHFLLPCNPNILDSSLLQISNFPTARSMLGLLYLCWLRMATIPEQQQAAGQPAKPLATLRNLGFIFEHSGVGAGLPARFTIRNSDGEECRKISGHAPITLFPVVILGSLKTQKMWMKSQKDFLTGEHTGLELDHRAPVEACRKAGIGPKRGSITMFTDGSVEKDFQALTRKTNMLKKTACSRCLAGNLIMPPPIAAFNVYKQSWEDGNIKGQPCIGCFWYDYRSPLVPKP